MDIKLIARVRQILQAIDKRSEGDDEVLSLSQQGELLVAIATSLYGETVRAGRSFEIHTTAALAAVVAVPTTARMIGLYNNEPDDGRAYVIDRIWALMIAGTAAAGQAALIRCLGQTRVAAPASAGLARNQLNGMGGGDTRAIAATAAMDAITGVAGNWAVVPGQTGGVKVGAGATPGVFINADVNGRIIVPPGRDFGAHVLADVVGSTFISGIEWHEKDMDVA